MKSENETLLSELTRSPLNSATLQALGRRGLTASPDAKALLRHIVSCALPAGSKVDDGSGTGSAGDPLGSPWQGELGLCGEGSAYADWETAAPKSECLELVSSCILARTNALGDRVVISLRGEPSCLFPMRDEVPVETTFRESSVRGLPVFPPIKSFVPCVDGNLTDGDPRRDCGWAPLDVGMCKAGDLVTVCAGATDDACACTDDPSSSQMMLRVCKGLYGCNEVEDQSRSYAGIITPVERACAKRASITFQCPANGPLISESAGTGERYGYYSVMVAAKAARTALPARAPDDPRPAFRVHAVVAGGAPGRYPAKEEEVFTYPEGAFYGYIFPTSDGQLQKCASPLAPQAMLSNDMYACYSEIWTTPMGELTDRYCAHPDGSPTGPCFVNTPQPCFGSGTGRCASDVNRGRGTYRDCLGVDAMPPWRFPITVYLNHPCDLAPGDCSKGHRIGKGPGAVPPQELWTKAMTTTKLPAVNLPAVKGP